MADRDEAKFRPEKSTWKGLSLKVLQSRIADPATILIAGVAAVLAFGVATTMTKAPVGSALAPLRGAPDSTGASRFLIDAYPMPGPMPFENLSRAAQREFTLDGQVEVVSALYVDRVSSNPVWTKQVIARNIAAADRRDPKTGPCTYFEACNSAFYEALEAHPVQGQNVLVVGSLDPWVEAICLSFKANSTTTVDFNPPKADDPRMRVWSIAELDSSEEVFDAILSYSSLEHDGLGRYGDPINPFGDLQRLHKLAGLIKPEGKLYLGVPNGPDFLFFNAHRIYGPIRFPMLIDRWNLLGTYGESLEDTYKGVFRSPPTCLPRPRDSGPGCFAQPVHVLKLKRKLSLH